MLNISGLCEKNLELNAKFKCPSPCEKTAMIFAFTGSNSFLLLIGSKSTAILLYI